jgi:hypothetical protein
MHSTFKSETLKGKIHLEDLDADETIILTLISSDGRHFAVTLLPKFTNG